MIYIMTGLIFLLLFFIIISLAMQKKEERLTDEFGKESNQAKENFYKNEKKVHSKSEEKIFKEKNTSKGMTPDKVSSLILNVLIAAGVIYFLSKVVFFMSFYVSPNYEAYEFIGKLNYFLKFMFPLVGFYGFIRKRKEGVFAVALFFMGNFSGTVYYLINMVMWFLIGGIFKGNYVIKISAFLAVLLSFINMFMNFVFTNSKLISYIGTVEINPSFSLMINILGILQAFLFLNGLFLEKKNLRLKKSS